MFQVRNNDKQMKKYCHSRVQCVFPETILFMDVCARTVLNVNPRVFLHANGKKLLLGTFRQLLPDRFWLIFDCT